ncbi:uncharacterized protein C8Q71DRAFT_799082 [Rhodofomes roseus]|uniref:Reverse transcriptase zinc-binding domain-containing protein n=1 Tax=Rhodofomes roseus TaxID=34475 RepID=A0ABQ8K2Y2_9APHY|nr:uncharacterized protein C8Q71DRAFT_799082 [Rhodofomes roseus]KAH9831184.1 hypothetical protein C8Q71DRAFT_799082 [Rhodofomes roseus]
MSSKLQALTQAIAYRGVMSRNDTRQRRLTALNISSARHLLEQNQPPISDETLWRSLWHEDFSRPFAVLLWKSMHGALRCGEYWLKFKGYEHRAQCSFCDEEESLEHILLRCPATGQNEVWEVLAPLWKKKGLTWARPSMDDLHSLGLTCWRDNKGRARTGATRLWRIMISEATHLIWKLRCERVIGHADQEGWDHDDSAVRNRIANVLHNRLRHDLEATKTKYNELSLSDETVLATWHGLIQDDPALPWNWTKCSGFLVGSVPRVCLNFDPG